MTFDDELRADLNARADVIRDDMVTSRRQWLECEASARPQAASTARAVGGYNVHAARELRPRYVVALKAHVLGITLDRVHMGVRAGVSEPIRRVPSAVPSSRMRDALMAPASTPSAGPSRKGDAQQACSSR